MNESELNTLSINDLNKILVSLASRISTLESFFQGRQIASARIANLKTDKLTTGVLYAVATLGGGTGSGQVVIDGENNRIYIIDEDADNRILIGKLT